MSTNHSSPGDQPRQRQGRGAGPRPQLQQGSTAPWVGVATPWVSVAGPCVVAVNQYGIRVLQLSIVNTVMITEYFSLLKVFKKLFLQRDIVFSSQYQRKKLRTLSIALLIP